MIPVILEKELTDRQRECIELAYFKNMSQRQVAKKLGLTQPTVKKHIDSGCERMKNILKYCFYAAEKAETFYLENWILQKGRMKFSFSLNFLFKRRINTMFDKRGTLFLTKRLLSFSTVALFFYCFMLICCYRHCLFKFSFMRWFYAYRGNSCSWNCFKW